jgi:hypothetical protein
MVKLDLIFDPILAAHADFLKSDQMRHYDEMSPEFVLRDVKTVRISVGRQRGHSSYIARTARPGDLILTKDKTSMGTMILRTRPFSVCGCHDVIVIQDSVELDRNFKNVWIDDASYVSPDLMTKIWDHFADKCDRIIMIG